MNSQLEKIRERVNTSTSKLIDELPDISTLTPEDHRKIIARYGAVLEGNFIAWMTSALLSVSTDRAEVIVKSNLTEELRDNHPGMLRKFLVAANAIPTDEDFSSIQNDLEKVRVFVGKILPVSQLVTMAFFENFISQFMPYLANLARAQQSTDFQYTDVHGVVDIEHTEGLYKAIEMEMSATSLPIEHMFEGIDILASLIRKIVHLN